MKRFILPLLIAATFGVTAQAQDLKLPPMSPTEKISEDFSTSSIDLSYSRPSMRDRKIFGGVVPYGKAWRTGANGPTKIKFGQDVTIGGQEVKAGEYILYSIPDKEEWEIILNKGLTPMTAEGYDRANDVARFKVKTAMNDKFYQTFTMEFASLTFNSCKLEIMWEKTKVVIPIEAHNEASIDASIDKAINNPSIPYFQVANYYYETNQHTDLAERYVNKALEQNQKAFYMWYLKARIEKRLGHKQEAIDAARTSMETAKGSFLEAEYQRNNQKIIDELK